MNLDHLFNQTPTPSRKMSTSKNMFWALGFLWRLSHHPRTSKDLYVTQIKSFFSYMKCEYVFNKPMSCGTLLPHGLALQRSCWFRQLFGIMQRKSFLRQACSVRQPVCKGSTSSVTLINRLDNSCIVVSGEQFRRLCTLYCARQCSCICPI